MEADMDALTFDSLRAAAHAGEVAVTVTDASDFHSLLDSARDAAVPAADKEATAHVKALWAMVAPALRFTDGNEGPLLELFYLMGPFLLSPRSPGYVLLDDSFRNLAATNPEAAQKIVGSIESAIARYSELSKSEDAFRRTETLAVIAGFFGEQGIRALSKYILWRCNGLLDTMMVLNSHLRPSDAGSLRAVSGWRRQLEHFLEVTKENAA